MVRQIIMSASAVLLLGWTSTAMALGENDALKINGGYALQHDSNLFRLPADVNASSVTGRPERDEWIGVASVGLAFKKGYGLQQLALSLNVLDYHYRHFSYLDFTAINYNAAWRWSLTPRLTGVVSTERIETLNSFADFQNTNQRNQRTNVNSLFDAEYALDGAWRVLGGWARATPAPTAPKWACVMSSPPPVLWLMCTNTPAVATSIGWCPPAASLTTATLKTTTSWP
jgi:hypothetical protein